MKLYLTNYFNCSIQVLDIFKTRVSYEDQSLSTLLHKEAAYAYDAAILLLRTLTGISSNLTLRDDVIKVIDHRLHNYTGGGVTV